MKNLLFKKDGIYVVIPEIDDAKEEEVKNDPNLVYNYLHKDRNSLFGSRVRINCCSSSTLRLTIDGISLVYYDSCWRECSDISLDKAAAYLNQIENLGVDTFLQNYKVQMQAMKDQLTEMSNQLVAELAMNEDKEKTQMLANIRKALMSLILVVCTLSIHLNASIDNYQYIDAYESVISQYAV